MAQEQDIALPQLRLEGGVAGLPGGRFRAVSTLRHGDLHHLQGHLEEAADPGAVILPVLRLLLQAVIDMDGGEGRCIGVNPAPGQQQVQQCGGVDPAAEADIPAAGTAAGVSEAGEGLIEDSVIDELGHGPRLAGP